MTQWNLFLEPSVSLGVPLRLTARSLGWPLDWEQPLQKDRRPASSSILYSIAPEESAQNTFPSWSRPAPTIPNPVAEPAPNTSLSPTAPEKADEEENTCHLSVLGFDPVLDLLAAAAFVPRHQQLLHRPASALTQGNNDGPDTRLRTGFWPPE